jgi:hypothetical protein
MAAIGLDSRSGSHADLIGSILEENSSPGIVFYSEGKLSPLTYGVGFLIGVEG